MGTSPKDTGQDSNQDREVAGAPGDKAMEPGIQAESEATIGEYNRESLKAQQYSINDLASCIQGYTTYN